MIPLLLSRRDKCKKTNIAQCMLHELSACAVKAVVWGFVFLFKHSTWRRPTPLRLRATSGCNQVCLDFRMVAERLCSTRSVIRRDVARK